MAPNDAIHEALQANKDHQNALTEYIGFLKNELGSLDKMLEVVVSRDDDDEESGAGLVYVETAVKPVSLMPINVLQSDDSPFHHDAKRRQRYEDFTAINQKLWKTKEHEALRESVGTENMRIQVLEAQARNQPFDVGECPPEYFEHSTERIDWHRVAVKINSLIPNAGIRTPRECEIRWRGHLHPSINRDAWTEEETARLHDIVGEDGLSKSSINWVEIANRLGTNRTPFDCMRHGMTRKAHTWTPEADSKLLEASDLLGQNNWQLVAMNVSEDVTAQQCQKRYYDKLDPSIKNGPWSAREEERLTRAVAAVCGTSTIDGIIASGERVIPWQDVALFVPGRTNNQCREHYQDTISRSKRKPKHNKHAGFSEGSEQQSPAVVKHDEIVLVLEGRENSVGGTVIRDDGEPESPTMMEAVIGGKDAGADQAVTQESPDDPRPPKPPPRRGRQRKKLGTEGRTATEKKGNTQAVTIRDVTGASRVGNEMTSSSRSKLKEKRQASARVASRRRSARLADARAEHEIDKTADEKSGADDEASSSALRLSKRRRTREK